MKVKFIYIIFCVLLVFVIGCETPPVAEMDNAREIVFRAENDPNAALYAAGTLARARDALQRMEDESSNKRYDAAKTYAAEAISLAERAMADGRIGASRVRDTSNTLVSDLRYDIEETERNINGARYSLLVLDYDELDKEIIDAHNAADRAEVNQAAGRHQEAIDIARDVRTNLSNINDRVAGAATARKK